MGDKGAGDPRDVQRCKDVKHIYIHVQSKTELKTVEQCLEYGCFES